MFGKKYVLGSFYSRRLSLYFSKMWILNETVPQCFVLIFYKHPPRLTEAWNQETDSDAFAFDFAIFSLKTL